MLVFLPAVPRIRVSTTEVGSPQIHQGLVPAGGRSRDRGPPLGLRSEAPYPRLLITYAVVVLLGVIISAASFGETCRLQVQATGADGTSDEASTDYLLARLRTLFARATSTHAKRWETARFLSVPITTVEHLQGIAALGGVHADLSGADMLGLLIRLDIDFPITAPHEGAGPESAAVPHEAPVGGRGRRA